jgi:hypothetical protein
MDDKDACAFDGGRVDERFNYIVCDDYVAVDDPVDYGVNRSFLRLGVDIGEAGRHRELRDRSEPIDYGVPRMPWLARTNKVDEMLARGQITAREHTAAIMYMRWPDYLGPLHRSVWLILFSSTSAEQLADPLVGRTNGIAEVMGRFRGGLRVLVEHYGVGRRCDKVERKATLRTLRARRLMRAALFRASEIKRWNGCRTKTSVYQK